MIVYASHNSGKTTFCKDHPEWIDGDQVLFDFLGSAFGIKIVDDNTKGRQIIDLFILNRKKAEIVYTGYMDWLKENRYVKNILLGTRRFMWLADIIIIKKDEESDLYQDELKSTLKWNLRGVFINKDEYINENLLNDEKSNKKTIN